MHCVWCSAALVHRVRGKRVSRACIRSQSHVLALDTIHCYMMDPNRSKQILADCVISPQKVVAAGWTRVLGVGHVLDVIIRPPHLFWFMRYSPAAHADGAALTHLPLLPVLLDLNLEFFFSSLKQATQSTKNHKSPEEGEITAET